MPPTEQDWADQQVRTHCLLILTAIAVGVALYLLRPVLVPFVLALFLSYCLKPLIDAQVEHLHMPRGPAVVGAVVLALLILGLIGTLVVINVQELLQNFQAYQQEFSKFLKDVGNKLPLKQIGLGAEADDGQLFTLSEESRKQFISAVLSTVSEAVTLGGLVVVFMVFLLLGRVSVQLPATGLLAEIETRLKHYIVRMVFCSALTGLLTWLPLALLGVPFAFLFGLLAFVLNFIPNIAIVSIVLPIPIILAAPQLTPLAQVLAVALPALFQFMLGTFVQPKLLGGALELHPIVVVMSLVFFGTIWGIVGAFLAVPITGAVKIVLERIPATRPAADLMAGNLAILMGPNAPITTVEKSPPADQ